MDPRRARALGVAGFLKTSGATRPSHLPADAARDALRGRPALLPDHRDGRAAEASQSRDNRARRGKGRTREVYVDYLPERPRQDDRLRVQRAGQRVRRRVDAARLERSWRAESSIRATSRCERCRAGCATSAICGRRCAGEGDRSGRRRSTAPGANTDATVIPGSRAPRQKSGNSTPPQRSRRVRSCVRKLSLASLSHDVTTLLPPVASPRRATRTRPRGSSPSNRRRRGSSGSGPLIAKIETTLGTFTCELFDKQAPKTVANFVGLARGTAPVEGPEDRQVGREEAVLRRADLPRVIPGFMIQGGDPLGIGTRQPRLQFEDESRPS